jgi:hypothetical protein
VTDIILPLAALSACIWILYHHLQTGSERLGLATMAAHGPDDWDRAWRQTGHLRHLLARLTCRDWRRLYPRDLVDALDDFDRDPVVAMTKALEQTASVRALRTEAARNAAAPAKARADRQRDAAWTAAARRARQTGEAGE